MKAIELSLLGNTLSGVLPGAVAALLVLAVLTGTKIPFLSSDRTALIVLVVLGMAMCARGIGRIASVGDWTHPLSILGYLVGALILVIAAALLAGKPLPLITTTRHAIMAVALLSAAKVAFSALHRWLF